jgi:uncharacterized RmlC-like cupin family protein
MAKIVRLSETPSTGKYEPGLHHRFGLSTDTCGARGACLVRVTIPPKNRTRAHFHAAAETFLYVLSGHARVTHGAPGIEEFDEVIGPETFVYWDIGEIHTVTNISDTETVEIVGGYSIGSGEASKKIYVEPPVEQPDAV